MDDITSGKIQLEAYRIIRLTHKGYWIRCGISKEKWVSKSGMKRFAYPQISDAWLNYTRRTLLHHYYVKCKYDAIADIMRQIKHYEKDFKVGSPDFLATFTPKTL
jgi:hypothetical protein